MGLVAALVLSMSGYVWATMQGLVSGLVVADVIDKGGGEELPADGARDIMLVGLDSRTDANGKPLSKAMLKELRAGKNDGELNTDTLILLHIPNDGSKAVAISLPRDSYVDIPGFGQHKINSAYARGKAAERQRLQADGVTDTTEVEQRSNQEGAKTLLATVEALTGRTIDNFASINLMGFYDITKAIGGIDVCLNNAVSEIKSHADFPAGRQTISGADALAFVRQRHGLPRGDLDRVVRQQVFMAGLARKTLSAGTLSNPGKLNDLMDSIKKSVVLNKGWDIVDFARQMSGLTGGQIQFNTIPVGSLALRTPEDGAAVEVDPAEVRRFIAELSGEQTSDKAAGGDEDPAQITVNVLNAAGVDGLAATVSDDLVNEGFTQGRVDNAEARQITVVRHAPDEESKAKAVAAALGSNIATEPDSALASGEVTVLLGSDFSANGAMAGGGSQPQGKQAQQQEPAPPDQQGQDGQQGQTGGAGGDGAKPPITAKGVTCVN
ncbi:MAG: LytR family transcriptional regulator [Actinophytocola sp.]|nr:LytR family transcriptional regulator [Actinophytocola sp.]